MKFPIIWSGFYSTACQNGTKGTDWFNEFTRRNSIRVIAFQWTGRNFTITFDGHEKQRYYAFGADRVTAIGFIRLLRTFARGRSKDLVSTFRSLVVHERPQNRRRHVTLSWGVRRKSVSSTVRFHEVPTRSLRGRCVSRRRARFINTRSWKRVGWDSFYSFCSPKQWVFHSSKLNLTS